MSATTLFPLAVWLEGTNQNSVPANDNALRIEALMNPALGFVNAAPITPADHDQWIVGTTWGGHAAGNVVIYLSGTWKEFASYNGMLKMVGTTPYVLNSGTWNPLSGGGGATQPWVTVGGRTHADIVTAVAAINALPFGGVLYFPAGDKYTSTGGHEFNVSCTVRGDGTADDLATEALSWVQCSSATADMFKFNVNTSHVYEIYIQNTSITTPTAGVGIHYVHGDGSRTVDVTVDGFYRNIELDNAGEWFSDRCFSYHWVDAGIVIANAAAPDGGDWNLSNLDSVSGKYTGSDCHIRYLSAGGGKIVNAKLNSRGGINAAQGIDVELPTGAATVDFLVDNVSIENITGIPIKMRGVSSSSLPNIMLRGIQAASYGNNAMIDIDGSGTNFDRIIIDDIIAQGTSGSAVIKLRNVDTVRVQGVEFTGHDRTLDVDSTVTNLRNADARLGTGSVTHSANVTLDLANADNWNWSMGGDAELMKPTNPSSGQTVQIRVNTNGHTLTFDRSSGAFMFPDNTVPTLTGKCMLTFQYDGFDNTFWLTGLKAFQ